MPIDGRSQNSLEPAVQGTDTKKTIEIYIQTQTYIYYGYFRVKFFVRSGAVSSVRIGRHTGRRELIMLCIVPRTCLALCIVCRKICPKEIGETVISL